MRETVEIADGPLAHPQPGSRKAWRVRLYFSICRLVLFIVAASASFSGFYQKWHFAEADMPGDDSYSSIETMLDGTAHRPSVYRRLQPATANWLDRTVPQAFKTSLDHRQASADPLLYAVTPSPTANNPQYSFRYLVIYVETSLFALLAVYAMYLVCASVGVQSPASSLAPVILILLVPWLMAGGGFFYDYAELAFFALAVRAALSPRAWVWLIPIAALGTWNKETFLLFLLTLYPLLRRNASPLAAALRTAALCIVSLAVLMPIRLRFAHNPGSDQGSWWLLQLHFFLNVHNLFFATEETYGVRMLAASTLLPVALLVWTAIRGWKHVPPAMQQHARIAAAINLPLYFAVCNPGEMRNLSMLYVTLLLLLAANLQPVASSWRSRAPLGAERDVC